MGMNAWNVNISRLITAENPFLIGHGVSFVKIDGGVGSMYTRLISIKHLSRPLCTISKLQRGFRETAWSRCLDGHVLLAGLVSDLIQPPWQIASQPCLSCFSSSLISHRYVVVSSSSRTDNFRLMDEGRRHSKPPYLIIFAIYKIVFSECPKYKNLRLIIFFSSLILVEGWSGERWDHYRFCSDSSNYSTLVYYAAFYYCPVRVLYVNDVLCHSGDFSTDAWVSRCCKHCCFYWNHDWPGQKLLQWFT